MTGILIYLIKPILMLVNLLTYCLAFLFCQQLLNPPRCLTILFLSLIIFGSVKLGRTLLTLSYLLTSLIIFQLFSRFQECTTPAQPARVFSTENLKMWGALWPPWRGAAVLGWCTPKWMPHFWHHFFWQHFFLTFFLTTLMSFFRLNSHLNVSNRELFLNTWLNPQHQRKT